MKVTRVEPLVLGTAWRNLTIVVVHTDEGIEDVGEVRMLNHADALLGYLHEAVPRHVLSSDPFDVESLVQRMPKADYARAGEIAMSAAAAVEIACRDIKGKALGQPVYRLLGGAVHDRLPGYANGWYQVDRTPGAFHAAARRVISRGYQALKPDPFGDAEGELTRNERALSVGLVEAVRGAIGADVAQGNQIVADGHFTLPAGPGLGITLDRSVIEQHPRRALYFDLHKEDWQLRQAETAKQADVGGSDDRSFIVSEVDAHAA